MTDAWLVYNIDSMNILHVSWKKIETDKNIGCFKISNDIAINFLTGKEQLNSYSVLDNNGVITLEKKSIKTLDYSTFWNLKSIDDIKNFKFLFVRNTIQITADVSLNNYVLYASLKNNPSWLIQEWYLERENISNNSVQLSCPNPTAYSYFLRKIK